MMPIDIKRSDSLSTIYKGVVISPMGIFYVDFKLLVCNETSIQFFISNDIKLSRLNYAVYKNIKIIINSLSL